VSRRATIVDYGSGNVLSVRRALEYCGAEVTLANRPDMVAAADRLVLPGVGAFAECMRALEQRQLLQPVRAFAASGRPFLGICVGMQILFDESEEFGRNDGLGLVPGKVERVPPTGTSGQPHRVPHIGWAPLVLPEGRNGWAGTILADVTPGDCTYFVHSYTGAPTNPLHRLADVDYNGCTISAAVVRDNISGTQFHPEKSGPVGLKIVSRFLGS
jgi:imidazole glycerol-phosphate synthase subunit HisH